MLKTKRTIGEWVGGETVASVDMFYSEATGEVDVNLWRIAAKQRFSAELTVADPENFGGMFKLHASDTGELLLEPVPADAMTTEEMEMLAEAFAPLIAFFCDEALADGEADTADATPYWGG